MMLSRITTLSLLLCCLWSSIPIVKSDGHLVGNSSDQSILGTPQTLEVVDCPAEQTTFTAVTEMVLEGRNELLSVEERDGLMFAFEDIYNALTQRSCDSYFRRIANLTWVNATNTLGETVGFEGRYLQASNSNTTEVPGLNVVYHVTGTCRDCPVSRAGAFELYDDSFRRALREQSGITLKPLRILQMSTMTLAMDTDCQCVSGTEPTAPQAPGVQECVDEMNLKFDNLRVAKGLFQGLDMTNLLQLDEDLEPAPEEIVDVDVEAVEIESSGSGSILDAGLELVQVPCPATQSVFVALTEMSFEGRNELLSVEERAEFVEGYEGIYNALAQQSCDSYFRRLANFTFVNMTNALGDFEVASDEESSTAQSKSGGRSLQVINTTDIAGVDVVYQVTGTCRDCPINAQGEFALYDDSYQAARRTLWEQTGVRMGPLRILQISTTYADRDCRCVNGTSPDKPVAPVVEELVEEMNVFIDNVKAETGLFEALVVSDFEQIPIPPKDTATDPPVTVAKASGAVAQSTTTLAWILSLGATMAAAFLL